MNIPTIIHFQNVTEVEEYDGTLLQQPHGFTLLRYNVMHYICKIRQREERID